MPSKKLVIAANWKMNGSLWFGKKWLATVAPQVEKLPLTALVFAPAPYVFPLGLDAQPTVPSVVRSLVKLIRISQRRLVCLQTKAFFRCSAWEKPLKNVMLVAL